MSKTSTLVSVDPKLTDAEASLKQTQQADRFGQLLLSHVDMCYSVALALTRNPYDARNLSREVLIPLTRESTAIPIGLILDVHFVCHIF